MDSAEPSSWETEHATNGYQKTLEVYSRFIPKIRTYSAAKLAASIFGTQNQLAMKFARLTTLTGLGRNNRTGSCRVC
jgi:hypothetical protein